MCVMASLSVSFCLYLLISFCLRLSMCLCFSTIIVTCIVNCKHYSIVYRNTVCDVESKADG